MKQTDLLRPCPFCGGPATIITVKPHTHSDWLKQACPDLPDSKGECFIECRNCSCAIAEKSKRKAIKAWNARAGAVGVDEFTVMAFALRYAITRLTYAPHLVTSYIISKLSNLNDDQLRMLRKECEDKFTYEECADDIAEHYVRKLLEEVKKVYGKH